MKIIVDNNTLKSALALTAKVINKNTVIPIIQGYLIEVRGNQLSITTTDLETSITKEIEAEVKPPFFSFVMDHSAAEFIKVLKGNVVALEVNHDLEIIITSEKKTGKFMGENSKDFPKTVVIESQNTVPLEKEILSAIEKGLSYVSNDDLRPAMTGIFFGEQQLCATDAHRMFTYDHKLGLKTPFIVPAKAANLLIKLGKSYMKQDANHVCFYTPNTTLVTRLIDARYPDYKCVIPKDNNITWKVSKAELQEAIAIVSIAANQTSKTIVLEIDQEITTLRAFDVDFCMEATDTLKSQQEGVINFPFRIAFNSTFLGQLVKDCKGDQVEFKLATPTKCGIMEQDKELILIMPLMLPGDAECTLDEARKALAEAKRIQQEKEAKKFATKAEAVKDVNEDEAIAASIDAELQNS